MFTFENSLINSKEGYIESYLAIIRVEDEDVTFDSETVGDRSVAYLLFSASPLLTHIWSSE